MKKSIISLFGALIVAGCSLEPVFYSSVTPDVFFDSPSTIYAVLARPFVHWRNFQQEYRWYLQECPTDEMCFPQRYIHYEDGGMWADLHHHEWTPDHQCIIQTWSAVGMGISLAWSTAEDLADVDYTKCGLDESVKTEHLLQLRALVAYFYLKGLDYFGGMPIYRSYSLHEVERASAEETFAFIEQTLKEVIPGLTPYKKGTSHDGFIDQGAAAVLLAQLYFNAVSYIGEDRFAECAAICQDIMDGKYGDYALSPDWKEHFGFDNDRSAEVIWAAPSANSQFLCSWYFSQSSPNNIASFYGSSGASAYNGICLQPSLAPTGAPYTWKLGRPFAKYHDTDVRKQLYRYNGSKQYEGMFLMGELRNPVTGSTCVGKWDYEGEVLDLVDMVAHFKQLGKTYADVSILPSDIYSGEENTGIRLVKYPTPTLADDAYRWDPDWVVIRLAEVYYMLAECKFRSGDKEEAARLFNEVRQRNFRGPDPDPVTASNIDKYRILDEWMLEFIGEGRRRTDLIRWDAFTTEPWWDHHPSRKEYLKRYPIPTAAISSSNLLKQNPGYGENI